MQSTVKGLGKVILLAGLTVGALAQPGYLPTVFFPVRVAAPGTVGVQTIIIPPQYMIGQFTHTLSVSMVANAGCTVSQLNQLVISLDGTFDNTTNNNWISIGAPISVITGMSNNPNQYTGLSVMYGAFPFLRVSVRRAFGGLNCVSTINYVGSTTPASFTTSVSQYGDQYTNYSTDGTILNTTPIAIANSFALGGKISVYGISVHNQDTTNPSTYTLKLYNKPSSACTGGTELDIAAYRIAAGGTFTLGFGVVPIFQFPNTLFNGTAGGLDTYDSFAGNYQICIASSASIATSTNIVTRSF